MAVLEDPTNYHWGNMLKSALISTLLGAGTELISNGDSDLVRALRFGTQDTISKTGRQVVQRQLNVPPTLTVRPGFSRRILVPRDLVLETVPAGGTRVSVSNWLNRPCQPRFGLPWHARQSVTSIW